VILNLRDKKAEHEQAEPGRSTTNIIVVVSSLRWCRGVKSCEASAAMAAEGQKSRWEVTGWRAIPTF